jgi:outer membrane protein assembly factor BamA
MRYLGGIWLLILILILGGCSNTRFLAEDQLLYTGQKKVHISMVPEDMSSVSERQLLLSGSSQKPNNSIFNRRVLPPIGLWVNNYWKIDEEKKFGKWAFNTLSSPPVLISEINPELRAQKIENDLFDEGHFQARAWSKVDTSTRNPRKAMVEYFVEVGPIYRYKEVKIDTVIESIDSLLNLEDFRARIKTGEQFKANELTKARAEVSGQLQDLGYFYFNQDFIQMDADTALGDNKLNLSLSSRGELPPAVLSKYSIDSIKIFISKSSDSVVSLPEPIQFKDLTIYTMGDYLKPDVIADALYFKPGDQYSHTAYRNSVARLNKLGVFSYVRISHQAYIPDSLHNLLNVRIDLIIADQISLNLETDFYSKSTGFMGPGVSVGVSHSNAFKGAEKAHVNLKGGFEWQYGPKEEYELGAYSYDFGINTGLTFPKLILPGDHSRIKGIMNQETSIQQNFEFRNRVQYYSMFSSLTNYKYSWGKKNTMLHSFSPLYFNSVSLLETTAAFDSIIDENIYIQKSFEEQFIFGMRYDFTYDNTHKKQVQNIYFSTGVGSAGNLLDLLVGIGKDESDRPYEIINTVYSQFIKLTTDFRYYLNGFNKTLAMRLYSGVGIPYRNSTVLPYVEQFFSGGAYSVRGFLARSLGPGSFYEEESTYIDQSGDIKLEANLEFRFGISKITKGAIFIETGNIWLINEDENRPGSQFNFDTFTNQLAVGTGVGLRFDFNFFVVRTDWGFPLRTPYLQNDKYWFSHSGSLFSNSLFYLAIGYPF